MLILQTPDAATFESFWTSVAVLPFAEYLRVFTIFILSAVAYYSRGAIRQAWGLLEDFLQTKRDALRTDEKEGA